MARDEKTNCVRNFQH